MKKIEVITFDQLDRELKAVFPNMYDWAPVASMWETITHEEVDELAELYPAKKWSEDFPCGLIARAFAAHVSEHYADGKGLIKALGTAHGTTINGTPKHTINIYRPPGDCLYLIDMQTREKRPAELGVDDVYFTEI